MITIVINYLKTDKRNDYKVTKGEFQCNYLSM